MTSTDPSEERYLELERRTTTTTILSRSKREAASARAREGQRQGGESSLIRRFAYQPIISTRGVNSQYCHPHLQSSTGLDILRTNTGSCPDHSILFIRPFLSAFPSSTLARMNCPSSSTTHDSKENQSYSWIPDAKNMERCKPH
jgi:hypothetical protein